MPSPVKRTVPPTLGGGREVDKDEGGRTWAPWARGKLISGWCNKVCDYHRRLLQMPSFSWDVRLYFYYLP